MGPHDPPARARPGALTLSARAEVQARGETNKRTYRARFGGTVRLRIALPSPSLRRARQGSRHTRSRERQALSGGDRGAIRAHSQAR